MGSPEVLAKRRDLRDFTTDARLLPMTAMALVIGAMSACLAYVLVWLIGSITNLVYYHRLSSTLVSPAANTLGWWAVLVPMVGGLVVGLMARYGSERIRGHGIPEAMEAILIGRSRMDAKVAVLKPISSAISIGTGGPFGAEGPIIMTGGAFGSLFAQAFHMSSAERKTLLVAGASAGMAAIFATPVAALLVAVELLLFEWKPRSFVPVAAACVVAYLLRLPLLGAAPIFPVAQHEVLNGSELGVALAVGVIAGLGSAGLTALVYGAEDIFTKLPFHYMWWPVIGGAVVGIGGLLQPRALGVGYDTIRDLLSGHMIGAFVLGLLVTKAVIWSIALGSGTSGGVLAPLLIMGGALGAIEGRWLPVGDPALWAMISMAAMMGGTMRSPLTAIAFLLELTHDVELLPGLLVGCVAAHAVTVLLMKRSILTEKVARRGYHVLREYTVDPFETMRISEIMAQPVDTLPDDTTVGEAVTFFTTRGATPRHKSYPVIRGDSTIAAMVARADALLWTVETPPSDKPLTEQLAGQELVTAYEDELVGRVADRMAETGVGRVPILRRGTDALVGIVARRDLLRVRASVLRQERERETLISLPGRRRSAAR